jgi:hypothetical protein
MANNAGNDNLMMLAKEEAKFESNTPIKLLYTPPKAQIDYQIKYDPSKAPIYRPVKTVVVSQDPPADQVVPPDTVVKVVVAEKSTLPVASFQVSQKVAAKYGAGDVGLILNDIDQKGQAVAPIFESGKGYADLSASEKSAFKEYASGVGLPSASEAEAQSLFEDLQFFHNF